MNAHPVALGAMVFALLAAFLSVFGVTFRFRILSAWIASLMLSLLFLILQNELLAFGISVLSTATTWVIVGQTLVYGDFHEEESDRQGWRNQIIPVTGALMMLGIIHLGTPPGVYENLGTLETAWAEIASFGAIALHRYFLFAIVVAAVAFSSIVGVGMISRAEWRRDGGSN